MTPVDIRVIISLKVFRFAIHSNATTALMIISNDRTWFGYLTAVRGSSIQETWPRILIVTVFATVVTIVKMQYGFQTYSMTVTPFSLVGLALAIFLGFRNKEAYDRFWEGRKLWGSLVNVSRSFTRQVHVFFPDGSQDATAIPARRTELVHRTIAFVHSLRHLLRGTDPTPDVRAFLPAEEIARFPDSRNVPNSIMHRTGLLLRSEWQAGNIHEFHLPLLEQSLTEFTAIQGACERIKSTLIPFTYNVLIHRIVALYCLALPLGLVREIGYLTPLVVAFISYAFFGLDEIGDEVEQPFGMDDNHLPLTTLSRMIEVDLLQELGTPADELPPLLQPVDGVLN